MKVKINEKENTKEREFPKLMISDNTIVLMISEFQGTCISGNQSAFYKTGSYREDWCIETFKDFEGSITISND